MTRDASSATPYSSVADAVVGVYAAINTDGSPQHKVAIRLRTARGLKWFLLDSGDLQNCRTDALLRMIDHIGTGTPLLQSSEIKEFCRVILKRATSPIVVVSRPGYYQLEGYGPTEGFYAYAGTVYKCARAPNMKVAFVGERPRTQSLRSNVSIETWKRTVGRTFVGNPYMVVGLGCALPVGVESVPGGLAATTTAAAPRHWPSPTAQLPKGAPPAYLP